jgi:uncharacterized membrane protein
MDFEKKMKQRLYIAVGYCVLGTTLIIAAVVNKFENYFISSFGFAMLIMGILRIVQNRKITKSEKAMHKREVAETDERNKMLAERAKSWTFSFSIMVAGIVVIFLSILGYHDQAQPFAWFVCLMVALYWVFYLIASRKY